MSETNAIHETTLTLQLNPQYYRLLEEAATLTGLSVTDYIIHHALSSAIAHTALHHSFQSPKPVPDSEPTESPESQPAQDPLAAILDHNTQDLNNIAKAILSTLAWSSPEILQKSQNSK